MAKEIGSRKGERFELASRPDEEDRVNKAVDALFKGKETDLAMEHTRIESFSKQIKNNHDFNNFIKPLEERLADRLPLPGQYQVLLGLLSLEGIKDIEKTRNQICDWIIKSAPKLELGLPKSALRHVIQEQPPGVPFEVILCRWPRRDGKIIIGQSLSESFSESLDEMGVERTRKALNDKCPKLAAARSEGTLTVLALELDDISLGDTVKAVETIVACLREREEDLPDEIYLVRTEVTDEWEVTIIKEGETFFPEIDGYESLYIEPVQLPIEDGRAILKPSWITSRNL